ncbi:MAG: LCP family protein [Actinomycetota bacterium]|nr:LCP family protein [Actinomycetota bacterium]
MSVHPGLGDRGEGPSARGMLGRFALAGLSIVLLAAAATATAGLLQVQSVADRLVEDGQAVEIPTITRAEAGEAQTLLLLGSDARWEDRETGREPRADTMMLVRLDPDAETISLLSIPRDLMVTIPGIGEAKVNDAYAKGGLELAVETVTDLTGLDINHVINVNFGGFREVINAVNCVYADIDRRYYHSNVGVPIGQRYDAIDIMPGYQRLCGIDALDYVRYRKDDSDAVRAARQQDFLRGAKNQLSTSSLLGQREELLDIFTSNTQTDTDLATTDGLLSLLKLSLFTIDNGVRQIKFPGEPVNEDGISYVEASFEEVDEAVEKFMNPPDGAGEPSGSSRSGGSDEKSDGGSTSSAAGPTLEELIEDADLVDGTDAAAPLLAELRAEGGAGMAVLVPSALTPEGTYEGFSARSPEPAIYDYTLNAPGGVPHAAYRMVVAENAARGRYYGIQGTTWRDPPLLANPDATVDVAGRRLEVFGRGSQVRFVAWRTGEGVYWVSNTLDLTLDRDEMLTIARSLGPADAEPAG